MKKLFYNPIEVPEKIKVKSIAFGLDIEYEPSAAEGKPVYFDDLYLFAKNRYFDSVQVFLTSHNEAYYRDSKNPIEKVPVTGWVDLCDYKKGGGYLDDKTGLYGI